MNNQIKLHSAIHAINSTSINGKKLKELKPVSDLIKFSNLLAEQNKRMAIIIERIDDLEAGEPISYLILADIKEALNLIDGQY